MVKKKRPAVRWKVRRGSPLLKMVILVMVVLSTITLVILHARIDDAKSQYEDMRAHAAVLVERNAMLAERMKDLGSVDSVIQIAMEELGLVLPDTTIFDMED